MYEVKSEAYTPDNFIAGAFPIAKESKTVTSGKTVKQYAPVKLVSGGTVEPVEYLPEADTTKDLYGIAVEAAKGGEATAIYLTGEFQAEALELEDSVTVDMLAPEFRKLGIFIK